MLKLLFAFVTCVSLSTASNAASISFKEDPVMGCFLQLDGRIDKGDAERFTGILAQAEQVYRDAHNRPELIFIYPSDGNIYPRICLNSPGGSLLEAIKIAKLIHGNWSTAVGRNQSCESACAVLFMGGTSRPEDDRGIIADRTIHPTAKLGFHAPGLVVAEGNYSATTVSNAYKVALQGMSALNEVSGYIKFSPSLLGEMIDTPPEEMMYIETVGQAARWQIAVAPTVAPTGMPALAAFNMCNNQYLFNSEVITLNGFYSRNHRTDYRYNVPAIEVDDLSYSITLGGFGQEGASECNSLIYLPDLKVDGATRPTARIGFVSIGEGIGGELLSSTLFGFSTPIASLQRQNDFVYESVDIHAFSKDTYQSKGRCHVFSGGKLIDGDPCVAVTEKRFRTSPYSLTTYIWPSGGKTVVEEIGDSSDYKINGVIAGIDYVQSWDTEVKFHRPMAQQAAIDNAVDWNGECWPNPDTGNTFCYQEYFDETGAFRR